MPKCPECGKEYPKKEFSKWTWCRKCMAKYRRRLPKEKTKIGRAKGNIMPVSWKGVDFKIPLSKRIYGTNCKETSFSPSKSTSVKRRDKLRKQGDRAYVKSFTASDKRFPKYKQTLHVVYQSKKGRR